MGHALALEFARSGYKVLIHDESASQLDTVPQRAKNAMAILAEVGIVEAGEVDEVLGRIVCRPALTEVAQDAQFVLEAVAEDLTIKQKVFAEIDRYCGAEVIFASNTSAISPTALGEATRRPDRVLVTHYFNPPYLLPAVEVVPGKHTSVDSIERAVAICQSMGKVPAVLRTEVAGFVVNRLQFALYREALSLVDQGIVSPGDLDRLVVASIGNRLGVYGPFKIADLAGLDVYESICRSVFPELDNSDMPGVGLRRLVQSGRLGAKSGAGVYKWSGEILKEVTSALARHAAMMFGSAVRS